MTTESLNRTGFGLLECKRMSNKCEYCGSELVELYPSPEEYLDYEFCWNIFRWKIICGIITSGGLSAIVIQLLIYKRTEDKAGPVKGIVGFFRNRTWFGFWWASICSAHGFGHYDHLCLLCRAGRWTRTPTMRYKQQYDGEWITPRRKNYYVKCCDCGLAHKIDFRLIGNKHKQIQFRAFRIVKRKRR